jgi:hypothetical protein
MISLIKLRKRQIDVYWTFKFAFSAENEGRDFLRTNISFSSLFETVNHYFFLIIGTKFTSLGSHG